MLLAIVHEAFSREKFSFARKAEPVNWLLQRRTRLGLRQEDVAEALGVTTRSIINWEKGHHEPRLTIRQTKALCEILRVPLDQMPDEFPFSS